MESPHHTRARKRASLHTTHPTGRHLAGNPRLDTDGASLVITGGATGVTTVNGSGVTIANGSTAAGGLTPLATPGLYSYAHSFRAVQGVSFKLLAQGVLAGAAYSLPAAGVVPGSVDYASVAAATLYVDASDPLAPRPAIAAAGPVAAQAWHVAHVPVNRTAAGLGGFVAEPGLNATLRVTPLAANGTALTNRTAEFRGFWSWTAGDYSVPFKLSSPGLAVNTSFVCTLTLAHPAGPSVSGGGLAASSNQCCSLCTCRMQHPAYLGNGGLFLSR